MFLAWLFRLQTVLAAPVELHVLVLRVQDVCHSLLRPVPYRRVGKHHVAATPDLWFHAPNRLVGGIRTGRQRKHHEAPPTHLPHGANPQSMSPAASIGSRSQHTPHPHGNKHVVEEEVHWQRERQQLRLREVLYSGLRWWPAAVALGNDLPFVNSRPGRKGRNVRLNRTHGHSVRHRT